MPCASTLIRLLLATLRTVEHSSHVSPGSRAIQKLRDGVEAMIAELESAARVEPRRHLSFSTGADLYQPRRR